MGDASPDPVLSVTPDTCRNVLSRGGWRCAVSQIADIVITKKGLNLVLCTCDAIKFLRTLYTFCCFMGFKRNFFPKSKVLLYPGGVSPFDPYERLPALLFCFCARV